MLADVFVGRGIGAGATNEGEDGFHDGFADWDPAKEGLGGKQIVGPHDGDGALLGWAGGCEQHRPLGGELRVGDVDLEEEAIKLRFGQGVGAFLFDGVLGGEDVEGFGERVLVAAGGDAAFLHGLEQGGLGSWAGAVDFVCHQKLAEDRAGDETEAASAGLFVKHFAADDIGGHQIGGELNPFSGKAKNDAQGFDEAAFAQAREADEKNVSAAEQGHEGFVDDFLLAEDDAPDGGAHGGDASPEIFDLGDGWVAWKLGGGGHSARH